MSANKSLYDVIIIGGGYSGMICGIVCAQNGLKACIIEKNEVLGRKILSTGNGRCNFSNTNMSLSNFNSNSSLSVFNFDSNDSVSFFNNLGVIEKNIDGYLYPVTNQAKTIYDSLNYEIKRLSIDVFTSNTTLSISKDNLFVVISDKDKYIGENVIIATGGKSSSKLGSSGDGYNFAKSFNIPVTKLAPALVGLWSNDYKLKKIVGVRALGKVNYKDHFCEGEIQFNKDSISGYPVMCISRNVGLDEDICNDMSLIVDFLPYMDFEKTKINIDNRISNCDRPIFEALNGLTNDKVIEMVLIEAGINPNDLISTISLNKINKLNKLFKQCEFKIKGTKGYENSQVTAGGINLDAIDLSTMMSKNISNLYFIGEILDVDGICGGYNLEWARYSAFLAANNIISK